MNSINERMQQLKALLDMEQEEEKRLLLEVRSRYAIKDRVKRGISWYPIHVHDWYYDQADRLIVEIEHNQQQGQQHEFNTGKLVAIFSQRETSTEHEIQGVVMAMRGSQAKVLLQADDLPEWLRMGKCGMDLLYDETSFKEMRRALHFVESGKDRHMGQRAERILGFQPPRVREVPELPPNHLNESQNRALQNALAAEDIAIIHGPPGTGKTTTLVALVQALCQEHKQLLVCAPSNNAVDLLVDKIHATGISVLRIGNPARINEHIQQHSLSYSITQHKDYGLIKQLLKKSTEYRNMASKYKRQFGHAERQQRKALYEEAWKLRKEAQQMESYITDSLIENAQVIATTLVGSAHQSIADRHYPVCLLDEASQALEPATWIPITRADKVVLAGDHHQLPPTVKSRDAEKAGLDHSLFEHCMQHLDVAVMLNTQYRMHQHIMHYSNQVFYDKSLVAHPTVEQHDLGLPDDVALEFVDTAGCGFDEERPQDQAEGSSSLQNPLEADVLAKHLYQLCEHLQLQNISTEKLSLGVISPYKAQVAQLRELLQDLPFAFKQISINTVDGFQGQERDIMYISLVRSNDQNDIGFLRDYRRMNVAMTRARKKLVMVGNSATIGKDQYYNDLLAFVEGMDGYRSAWEFLYPA